jgi:spore maturation protein CgeB
MVTHPDNDYWFKRYLKPMVHYVPIQYDLSDLAEKITWLVEHDDEAKKIADNAMAFSKLFFSPEFQRNHLIAEIGRIRQCMNGTGSPEKASPLPEWDPLKMAPGPSG